jgi:hypothetical protein
MPRFICNCSAIFTCVCHGVSPFQFVRVRTIKTAFLKFKKKKSSVKLIKAGFVSGRHLITRNWKAALAGEIVRYRTGVSLQGFRSFFRTVFVDFPVQVSNLRTTYLERIPASFGRISLKLPLLFKELSCTNLMLLWSVRVPLGRRRLMICDLQG